LSIVLNVTGENEAKVMKISPQGQIRIPKKVLESLKIVPGDYIEMAERIDSYRIGGLQDCTEKKG
jgi:bifunctional DNA-binding transcriptional regulator/antitoxin component of YhaV-PrlF toxin-antitoxin module